MLVVLYPGNFVLYLSYVLVILPLYCYYIHNYINMFVNVIYIFTAIRWCALYEILLGCNPSWEACNAYKYIICYAIVAILVDLNLKKWINIFKKDLSHALKHTY